MGKRERRTFREEFKQEAVRLTETSGRPIAQVSDDIGIGLSTLTRSAAELALGRYIDGFYNPRWRHSALGYKSPVTFEAKMAITDRKPLH